MPELMTPEQIAARTSRAVAAATAAGRDLGLEVTEPTVLYDLFSVVVHLAPSPVVVRVPTVLMPGSDPEIQAARQRRELDVVRWLVEQGAPVVPPSPLVPLEPVRRDGFSMTFWQLVDKTAEPDFVRGARMTADLHATLREYPGELPFLSSDEPDAVRAGLTALEGRPDLMDPADLDRAQREWAVLAPLVGSRERFEAEFPGVDLQPLHGDAPAYNVIVTADGPLHGDFELTALGPVEWDLASFGPECADAYDEAAQRRGLRRLDQRALRFIEAVGMSRTLMCLALVPQLPSLADLLKPSVEHWRELPFAGGVTG
ncbi:phosphotransferase [Saccharopolyspora cebuensis]|uniref:Phosphotransferase family protein n=1 Tax=Saccharopolyspora cebuensis TaxID=418759 RepID=A0ABV4CPG6_9PSEU